MAHFAKVKNGVVLNVVVADQGWIDKKSPESGVSWVQTSYNTIGGVHYGQDRNPDGGVALRKNYAAIGGTYDKDADAFYKSPPYPSWVLNTDTYLWDAPVSRPSDEEPYEWDEDNLRWVAITFD